MEPPRAVLSALYAPVLIILLTLMYKTAWLLAHGQVEGLYLIAYATGLWLVGRRARRAWRGELERPWLDVGLLVVADALWGFLMFSQFQ